MSNYVPIALIIIGALMSAIGGIWLQRKSDDSLKAAKTELTDYMTGGASFCYLSLTAIDSTNSNGRWVVVHSGKFPLYDVEISIVDLQKICEISNVTLENVVASRDIIHIGNISPNLAVLIEQIVNISGKQELKFNIFITARNGFAVQNLRIKYINGKWLQATRVIKNEGSGDKAIFTKIDNNYPHNIHDDIDWND